MSLNYDLTAIPLETRTIIAEYDDDFHNVKQGDRIMNPVTNALIWATMGVDLGCISEDNALEFFTRLNLMEKLHGASLSYDKGDRFLTYEDVITHVGLGTNVSNKTRTQWMKRFGLMAEDEAQRAKASYERKLKAAA